MCVYCALVCVCTVLGVKEWRTCGFRSLEKWPYGRMRKRPQQSVNSSHPVASSIDCCLTACSLTTRPLVVRHRSGNRGAAWKKLACLRAYRSRGYSWGYHADDPQRHGHDGGGVWVGTGECTTNRSLSTKYTLYF